MNGLWRFEASGVDPGPDWRLATFDDSAWGGTNTAVLVGYWPFDGDATAVIGTSGATQGGPTPASDHRNQSGKALAFSGLQSQHVTVAGGGGLNAASAGTISLWVKWTGVQDADCCGGFGDLRIFGREWWESSSGRDRAACRRAPTA